VFLCCLLPNHNEISEIERDASGKGVGAVLMRKSITCFSEKPPFVIKYKQDLRINLFEEGEDDTSKETVKIHVGQSQGPWPRIVKNT